MVIRNVSDDWPRQRAFYVDRIYIAFTLFVDVEDDLFPVGGPSRQARLFIERSELHHVAAIPIAYPYFRFPGTIRMESDPPAIGRKLRAALVSRRCDELSRRALWDRRLEHPNSVDIPILRVRVNVRQPVPVARDIGEPEVRPV